jgi:hypothetical protein
LSLENCFTHFLSSFDFLLDLLLHELAESSDVLLVGEARVRRNELRQKFRVLPARPDVVNGVSLRTKDALQRLAAVWIGLVCCRLKKECVLL